MLSFIFKSLIFLSATLKNVDFGRMAEILVQRAGSPDEFTRLTSITWISEFVRLAGDQLVPYYADVLGATLPLISDKEDKIRVVASNTNKELRAIHVDSTVGFNIGAMLSISRELTGEWEATKIEALRWIAAFLARYRAEVISYLNDILDSLFMALSDPSEEVVLLVLEVHAAIAQDASHFRQLLVFLVHNFRSNHSLLEKRGVLIVRRLCVLLDAEQVYREFSMILEGEDDLNFASIMVQALNLILLTSSELAELRSLLNQSMVNSAGRELFLSLYSSWCHSSMATISLCILAQAYSHASSIIQSLGEEDINEKFLIQLEKFVRLLESPTFVYLRFQLLEPGKFAWLLKCLYGLLMLLPQQTAAFDILRTRLKTVPSNNVNSEQLRRSLIPQIPDDRNQDAGNTINFTLRLQQFGHMQHQHRMHAKSHLQSRLLSVPSQEFQRLEISRRPSPVPHANQPSTSSR